MIAKLEIINELFKQRNIYINFFYQNGSILTNCRYHSSGVGKPCEQIVIANRSKFSRQLRHQSFKLAVGEKSKTQFICITDQDLLFP